MRRVDARAARAFTRPSVLRENAERTAAKRVLLMRVDLKYKFSAIRTRAGA